jgi:hypothetical protein
MPPPTPPIPGHLAFTADQLRAELATTPAAELQQLIEQAENIHHAYLRERWGTEEKLEEDQLNALLLGGGFGLGRLGGIGNRAAGFGPGGSTGTAMPGGVGAGWGGMGGGPAGGAMGAGGGGAGRSGATGMSDLTSVGQGGHGGHGVKGQGDEEHTSKYLLGDDPNEIFGTDEPTAPPVIGE